MKTTVHQEKCRGRERRESTSIHTYKNRLMESDEVLSKMLYVVRKLLGFGGKTADLKSDRS